MASILVTGGTGNLGNHVVPLLRGRGHDLRLLSRTPREGVEFVVGDTVAGTGLAEAVAGVDVVLHLAGSSKGDDVGTANLAQAARRGGVGHLVMISVIGADVMPIGYFRAKERAEEALPASRVPFTVLRAAQFHDFAWNMFAPVLKLPVVPAPGAIRLEPVDVGEVAARLAGLVDGAPSGRVTDLVGPEVIDAPTMPSAIAAARGLRRSFFPVRVPGAIGRAYRDGVNLAAATAEHGSRTWAEYLQERAAVPAAA